MTQRAFELADFTHSPDETFTSFPSTRYQGSKRKLLPFLNAAFKPYEFSSVLDLYSGTSSVSLMFRQQGKVVFANDYMLYNYITASTLLKMNNEWLKTLKIERLIYQCFQENSKALSLVTNNFSGIFFPYEENRQIDLFCCNLNNFTTDEQHLLIYLMGQAMLMKRPYNLFHRANLEMRMKDVPRSFGNAKTWETPFAVHMARLFQKLTKCDFIGPQGTAFCVNSIHVSDIPVEPDLIYLDPPYLNKTNTPVDYSTFYHFLDGLVDYSLFAKGNDKYGHKPIALRKSRWQTAAGGLAEVRDVLRRWPKARVAISYRGDGRPTISELKSALTTADYCVEEHKAVSYKYALSKNFDATEHLIIGTPNLLR